MADASRLRGIRRPGLGTPPPPDEARDLAPTQEGTVASSAARHHDRVDGRTLRRSGRTVQFATRVSPEFDERIRRIAVRDGILLVEVLERALDAYEAESKKADR